MTTADWSVLELDGVMPMVTKVAGRIANDDVPLMAAEDVEQEAYLILATNPIGARTRYDQEGVALVAAWLRRRLLDKLRPELARNARQVSFEESRDSTTEFDTKEGRREARQEATDRQADAALALADFAAREAVGLA